MLQKNTKTKYTSEFQPVPQGSNLGPILYLCYTKGMPKTFDSLESFKLILCADDSNLKLSTISRRTRIGRIKKNLQIKQFLDTNKFLNVEKTLFKKFTTKQIRTS